MQRLTRDGDIVEAAKAEHLRLKDSVIRAAKLWRTSKGEELACRMLNDAVQVLFSFEQRHRARLFSVTRENEQAENMNGD